jgi:hypothetical protein
MRQKRTLAQLPLTHHRTALMSDYGAIECLYLPLAANEVGWIGNPLPTEERIVLPLEVHVVISPPLRGDYYTAEQGE